MNDIYDQGAVWVTVSWRVSYQIGHYILKLYSYTYLWLRKRLTVTNLMGRKGLSEDQWNLLLLNYSMPVYISLLQFFHSGTRDLCSALLHTLYKAWVRSLSHAQAFRFATVHSKNHFSLLFFIFIACLELIHYLQEELKRHGDIS